MQRDRDFQQAVILPCDMDQRKRKMRRVQRSGQHVAAGARDILLRRLRVHPGRGTQAGVIHDQPVERYIQVGHPCADRDVTGYIAARNDVVMSQA